MEALIERTQPDLITITGDLSWAKHDTALAMLADYLNGFGIPWAPIWGNHDQEKGMDGIEQAVAAYEKYSGFTYEAGDPAMGNGNYVIAIRQGEGVIAGLVMMDSHNKAPYRDASGQEKMVYAKLTPQQIAWYQQQIEALRQMGCRHTVLMTHIPIYGYRPAIEEWKKLPGTQKVFWEEKQRFIYLSEQGDCREAVCSYPEDEGMLAKIKELGSTRVVIAGHDHINNTILDSDGVKLVYALKTGPGCYWQEALNGGTVIAIRDNGNIAVHHEFVDAQQMKL